MRVKSVISRMGKKISLAMLAIVFGAAIGAGSWSLKSAQSAVSVSAEEGADTKFNATDLLSGEATIATNETLGVSGVTFNGYSDTNTRSPPQLRGLRITWIYSTKKKKKRTAQSFLRFGKVLRGRITPMIGETQFGYMLGV